MAKKPSKDLMERLGKAFKEVGSDEQLARAVLDLALTKAYGFNKAFDAILEEHRLAKQQELDVGQAENALNRDYMEDVRDIANDAIRAIKDGEVTDAESLREHVEQSVDGTQRVIYTHRAKLGLCFTEHPDAYIDDFGAEGAVGDDGIQWSRLMYAAMMADVMVALERLDVDVNDPVPEDPEDDD